MKTEITGADILALGYPEGEAIGLALKTVNIHFAEAGIEEIEGELKAVLDNPKLYVGHLVFGAIAEALLPKKSDITPIRDTPLPFKIYGPEWIEEGALRQINTAMKLPVTRAGALMPDAHQGYGLPIGGVLATENAVIPYAVGVDIGCRMCLSIYELPVIDLETRKDDLKRMLVHNAKFGREDFAPKHRKDHEILSNPLFDEINMLKTLKDKAAAQLGSSGGGNHFVEWGIVDLTDPENEFNLAPGSYLALLSHSGSRGLGATIASKYTKVAMEQCKLPDEARHLAWLDLKTSAGQEYWLAMNLAGDYASACHHQIHERMAVGLRSTPLAMVENHHNFAWKELGPYGREYIVHRKGATPAGKGVLGVIPGSMTAPGYIVRGKGDPLSLSSAAHGAGRTMSRTKAKNTFDQKEVSAYIKKAGVEVIGSGLDEAPMAYKDIVQVMSAQKDLIEIVGTFQPKIVRMCGDKRFKEVD